MAAKKKTRKSKRKRRTYDQAMADFQRLPKKKQQHVLRRFRAWLRRSGLIL